MERLMIDTDVMINWLAQEEYDGEELWSAPAIILELGEKLQLENFISLITIFEIRFVLRRKKKRGMSEVEEDLSVVQQIIHSLIPTETEMKRANDLQSTELLDPFDSIILAQAISFQGILISRDQRLLKIAKEYIYSYTPEDYIKYCLN